MFVTHAIMLPMDMLNNTYYQNAYSLLFLAKVLDKMTYILLMNYRSHNPIKITNILGTEELNRKHSNIIVTAATSCYE
jgi:hypothetical protein